MTRKLCKIIPNLDPQRTRMLNLTVLQRIDCFIQAIILTASYVSLYEFNVDTNQWSRKDVEGSLFVVKRIAEPRYQFIVMNRRNTENLVENLFGDFEYDVKGPFLLYRNVSQEINGIWFYNQHERDDVANFFSWVFDPSLKVPQMAKTSSSKSGFEELELGRGMPLVGTSLDSSLTAPTTVGCPEKLALENLFEAVTISGGASDVLNSRESYHHSSNTGPLASHIPNAVTTPLPTPWMPSHPLPSVATHDKIDPISSSNQAKTLVRPSSFASPFLSASFAAPISSPRPPSTAPALQPPPPPPPFNPSPSAPSPSISRNKVRDALMILIQDDKFIDIFYEAMLKACRS